ncbi:hypothetical protein M433DRAFT_71299 [Acidomyces richmondensis BFW]|nr:MAG: hypothetical protein FE78DRAFT_78830 [Acidomyces sp. 'richmondensis']KYG43598.1 hypothetical protein M433DRAFT_71299 [Acidomyces richmondensis BFW]
MSFYSELSSWWAPAHPLPLGKIPLVGEEAPHSPNLPLSTGQPAIVVFLRHCGCPFAEKTFLNLRQIARANRHLDVVVVSHSDEAATNTWLNSLPQAGSESSNLRVVVDDKLEAYAQWGLGSATYWHVLNPWTLYEVARLRTEEGIMNRPTESGSRWQRSGFFAVDGKGIVRWGRAADRANDIPDFEEAAKALEYGMNAGGKE